MQWADTLDETEAPPDGAPPLVLHASVVAIYISSGHDYWTRQGAGRLQHGVQEVTEVECMSQYGLRGDRYIHKKAGHKGQVTFLDADVVEEVRQLFKLPKLPASIFRRNVILRGASLKDLLGKRFLVQGVEFEGSQECKPCHWMDRVIADGAEEYLKANFRGGLRAKIFTSGMLRSSSA
ncbi:MOSC domain-containing protein [Prosthecobacter sp.]|uniref:MOSC domain-containing protein n=1 Tax=Prosthecobacter sp. TaxID=1965333 RepID=UPI00378387D5